MSKRFLFVVTAAILSAGSLIGTEAAAAPPCPSAGAPREHTSQVTLVCGLDNEPGEASKSPSVRAADRMRQLQMSLMLVNDYRALFDSECVRMRIQRCVHMNIDKIYRGIGAPRYSVVMEGRPDCRVLTIVAKANDPVLAHFVARKSAEILREMVRNIFKVDNIRIVDEREPDIRCDR